jgi:hypothetical protein
MKGLLIVSLLFPSAPALAWSSGGHMVIAAEAYRELSPALKSRASQILKSHPDYDTWVESFRPGNPSLDLNTFVFMKASAWPDEISRRHNHFDHPRWHYVDYPLRPPSFPVEPGPMPNDDALYGIGQCEKALASSATSPELRAVYLSYLIHLIGDIHQPLHCASLFNSTYPDGDKGGNDFFVRQNSKGIRLHGLWDGLLGTSSKPGPHLNYALEIDDKYPRHSLKELTTAKDAKEWSLESRAVAIDAAYFSGRLKGSTSAENVPALPPGYTRTAKTVAERQAALAGYRLTDDLRNVLSK